MDDSDDRRAGAAWPRKFSWPMRIFVCFFVGDMVLRSILSLLPHDVWREQLEVDRYPRSLPTAKELIAIDAGTHPEGYSSAGERLMASVGDVPRFFSPWPSRETRARLTNGQATSRYAATWLVTRLCFIGNVLGISQSWPMFSPNTVTGDTIARFRLVYGDGSVTLHRTIIDPIDPTRVGHFGDARARRNVGKAHEDVDVRLGYCRWLAGRFSASDSGSPLERIEVFKVRYEYPGPYDDARAFLEAQIGPPADQQEPVFWVYDAATRTGKYVE